MTTTMLNAENKQNVAQRMGDDAKKLISTNKNLVLHFAFIVGDGAVPRKRTVKDENMMTNFLKFFVDFVYVSLYLYVFVQLTGFLFPRREKNNRIIFAISNISWMGVPVKRLKHFQGYHSFLSTVSVGEFATADGQINFARFVEFIIRKYLRRLHFDGII
uniref:Uncharacterized protein n=1 Tax=Glossina austeni TaxID=7395 RepID=A0A1A9VMM2_GLOAU